MSKQPYNVNLFDTVRADRVQKESVKCIQKFRISNFKPNSKFAGTIGVQ